MLEPGELILIDCPIVNPPHDKFALVLSLKPKPLFAFINSRINEFIQKQPRLLEVQVLIDCRHHTCLNYDSYLDCSEVVTQSLTDIEEQLRREPSRDKGRCSTKVLKAVVAAINKAHTISPLNKQWITDALEVRLSSG